MGAEEEEEEEEEEEAQKALESVRRSKEGHLRDWQGTNQELTGQCSPSQFAS
jgi:hypothetical protein